MDGLRFDALTRHVSGVTTRRAALAGLSGVLSLLAALLAGPGAEAQRRPKLCRPPGGVCSAKHGLGCCGGATCRRGRCRCGKRQRVCRGRCIGKNRCCRNRDCGGGAACRQGRCQCPGGKRLCGKRCVPKGACCPGEIRCNGQCANLKTSNQHCGSCANACAGTATCQGGACVAGGTYRFVRQWDGSVGGSPFEQPMGVAVNSAGFVYVTDDASNRIWKFTSSGGFIDVWASTGATPTGIDINPAGTLYVSNASSDTIQSYTGDDIPGAALITDPGPSGVGVSRSGDIYVAIRGGGQAVQRFHPNGDVDTWEAPAFVFDDPWGVGVAPNGDVYVSDNGTCEIKWFSAAGAAKGVWGDEGDGDGFFEDPAGLTVDAAGFVYVADIFNHRIQKFTASGGFVGKFGDKPVDDPVLEAPFDVAVSLSGMVYVADGGQIVVQYEPA